MLKRFHWLIIFIFFVSLVLRLNSITRVGETWDEFAVAGNGSEYIKLIAKKDFSRESWKLNYEHPPIAKYIFGASKIVPKVFPAIGELYSNFPPGREYLAGRVISALLGSITVILTILLANIYFGPRIAIISSLLLAFSPTAIAHNRINGLETPLSLFLLASFYCFVRFKKYRFILAGLLFGLACGTRFNAFLLAPLFPLVLYFERRMLDRKFFVELLTIFASAGFIFTILWPWLWSNPLSNLLESMKSSSIATQDEYFLGSLRKPPWYYYFPYFIATTPPLILLGFLRKAVLDIKSRAELKPILWIGCILTLTASLFPLKQDGIRYIFHLLPFICILASAGLYEVWNDLNQFLDPRLTNLLVLTVSVLSIWGVMATNPYQLDYFNILVGGPRNVYNHKLFEINWWGEGIYEAVEWVNQNAPEGAGVNAAFIPLHVAPNFRSDLNYSAGTIDREYVITNTYAQWYQKLTIDPNEYQPVYVVSSSGAPLVTVFQRNHQ